MLLGADFIGRTGSAEFSEKNVRNLHRIVRKGFFFLWNAWNLHGAERFAGRLLDADRAGTL